VQRVTAQPEQIQAQQQQPTSPVASPTAARSVVEPVSPMEESTIAAKVPETSPVKTVTAMGVAVRPEQPFPDPFGGVVEEDAFDVDLDTLCGFVLDQDQPSITAQPKQIQAQQQQPTSPVPAPSEVKPVEAPKEEPTVDTENTFTPAVTAEINPVAPPAEVTKIEVPKEESAAIAQEASPKAAGVASEGQEKTEGVFVDVNILGGSSPQAEEQKKIQEEPNASPAPKQEAPKPEEPLQLETQEQKMIEAKADEHAQSAAQGCGCMYF
jgi:hypothetical protein